MIEPWYSTVHLHMFMNALLWSNLSLYNRATVRVGLQVHDVPVRLLKYFKGSFLLFCEESRFSWGAATVTVVRTWWYDYDMMMSRGVLWMSIASLGCFAGCCRCAWIRSHPLSLQQAAVGGAATVTQGAAASSAAAAAQLLKSPSTAQQGYAAAANAYTAAAARAYAAAAAQPAAAAAAVAAYPTAAIPTG